MIDNLDKSWKKDGNISLLSKFILGLLGVTGRIAGDFSVNKFKHKKLNFHLIIFLRSDIFRYVLDFAREPDKMEITKLRWNDSEIIFKILEERFVALSSIKVSRNDLWDFYICSNVNGTPIKQFIANKVFPRPRDYIFFFRKAKDIAVSRGHSKIDKNDVISAYEDYSNWIFKSLIVENGISYGQMEDFMYTLLGEKIISSKELIERNMAKAKIDQENIETFIDHLSALSIIGREIKPGQFAFEYDMEDSKRFKLLSQKLPNPRLKIHEALQPYLMLEG